MKFALASDIHLEFGQLEIKNTKKADVLILSGDIFVVSKLGRIDNTVNIVGEGTQSDRYHKFMQQACSEFPHVVYVMGNHEHYHGDFEQSANIISDAFSYLPNLHFLEKSMFVLNDVTFVGGTLWTDFNQHNPLTMLACANAMNDFRVIRNGMEESGPAWFTTEVAYQNHIDMISYIKAAIRLNPKGTFVVVGHHAPSKQSIHQRYIHDAQINGAYSSDLEYLMHEFPQIKIWTHGHTHHPFDYKVNKTRIICNPRGYISYEPDAKNFELKYFSLRNSKKIV